MFQDIINTPHVEIPYLVMKINSYYLGKDCYIMLEVLYLVVADRAMILSIHNLQSMPCTPFRIIGQVYHSLEHRPCANALNV